MSICCIIPNLGSVHPAKGTKKKDRKWLFCCMSEAQKINETSEYGEQVNTSSCYYLERYKSSPTYFCT